MGGWCLITKKGVGLALFSEPTCSATMLHGQNTYYTTEMHYTNEVEMPDAASMNLRAGYRSIPG